MPRIVTFFALCTVALRLDAGIITSTSITVGALLCTSEQSCVTIDTPFQNQYGSVTVSANASGSVGPSGISLAMDAYANSGSNTIPSEFPNLWIDFAGGFASAQFSDQAVILGPPQGFLDVTVVSVISQIDGFGSGQFSVGGVGVGLSSGLPPIHTILHVPFQSGQPISITGSVGGWAIDFNPNNGGDGSEDVTASLLAEAFTVFDLDGHRVSDFRYSSMSGEPLPFLDGVFIPEPSTFLLLTTGLVVILLRR